MTRRWSASLLAAALAVAFPACASRPSTEGPEGTARPTNRRVIALEELRSTASQSFTNLYDFISSRRSEWLHPVPTGVRGRIGYPVVWLDNQRLGGLEMLRTLSLNSVVEVRFLTPSEAQGRLGLDNTAGAILALTRL
jgi:hypothetical protein